MLLLQVVVVVVITPKSTLDRRNKFVICFLVNKTAQFLFLIACQCPEEEIVDRKRQTDDLFKEKVDFE